MLQMIQNTNITEQHEQYKKHPNKLVQAIFTKFCNSGCHSFKKNLQSELRFVCTLINKDTLKFAGTKFYRYVSASQNLWCHNKHLLRYCNLRNEHHFWTSICHWQCSELAQYPDFEHCIFRYRTVSEVECCFSRQQYFSPVFPPTLTSIFAIDTVSIILVIKPCVSCVQRQH